MFLHLKKNNSILLFKITNEKKEEIQHRANILLSFKSAKESIIDTLNEGKEKILNAAEQVKEAVTGDKDL